MSVSPIMNFIIISSVFLHTHSADEIYSAVIPQTITALTGSCVQIPCTFNIDKFEERRKKAQSIYGIWLKNKSQFADSDSFIAFNSSENITRGFSAIQMTGDLKERNCTTVFYNNMKNHSDVYYFRLEMEPNVFRATFKPPNSSEKTVKITVRDSPEPPALEPNDLSDVMEGRPVTLICSAEAPCPKQPPTISWSHIPESAHITTQIQEKPDKTQSVFSQMSFNASYRDHNKSISCTATYPRNTAENTTVETTVTLRVLFPPKETHITISPSSVSVGTKVTLTCRSKASPSLTMNYTWYKRGQKTSVASGEQFTFSVTQNNTGWYSCTAQNKHGNQSSEEIQLTVEGRDGHSTALIAGCVGGIVAVLTLSAFVFFIRTRKKTLYGSNAGEKDSPNQAQDEATEMNSTYTDPVLLTNQNKNISDDQSVYNDVTDVITSQDSRNEDNNERGSDVVYAQVHILHKNRDISVQPDSIYAQVKK